MPVVDYYRDQKKVVEVSLYRGVPQVSVALSCFASFSARRQGDAGRGLCPRPEIRRWHSRREKCLKEGSTEVRPRMACDR